MPRHWKTKGVDGDNLENLFKSGDINLSDVSSKYIASMQEKYHNLFGDFSTKVFAIHYKACLAAHKAINGSRRQECSC
jgi:hypothetical protein